MAEFVAPDPRTGVWFRMAYVRHLYVLLPGGWFSVCGRSDHGDARPVEQADASDVSLCKRCVAELEDQGVVEIDMLGHELCQVVDRGPLFSPYCRDHAVFFNPKWSFKFNTQPPQSRLTP